MTDLTVTSEPVVNIRPKPGKTCEVQQRLYVVRLVAPQEMSVSLDGQRTRLRRDDVYEIHITSHGVKVVRP